MWRVDQPNFDVGDVYDACTNIIRKRSLRDQMSDIRAEILLLSDDYDAKVDTDQIHLFDQHKDGVGDVSCVDLKKNYTQRMAVKGKPARPVYDALLSLPKNNRCPFCNYGSVEDLDHYLPKALFPGVSVKPENLVGCCKRCNKLKDDIAPTGPHDGFLHPYFNTVNDTVWLVANVLQTAPAALRFRVKKSAELSANLNERIAHQFRTLELAKLYSDIAADEVADNMDVLHAVYSEGGAAAVEAHLLRQAKSCRKANTNSWRAATYYALAVDEWYCSGGFRGNG